MALIPLIAQVGKAVFKYRRQIYSVITAQDRAIKAGFRGTKISKATQYGWRSGAAAGGLLGSLINNDADDSPGNVIQKPFSKRPSRSTTNKSYQTRGRYSRRSGSRCPSPKRSNNFR